MMYKRYITRRRARFQCIFEGRVNLPWGTAVENRDGFLYQGGKLLCAASSQNAKEFFVQDDDGQGETRGRLVTAILARLGPQKAHQRASSASWEKIWADRKCRPYRRTEDEDYWIWNENFYNAPIGDLRHIADLVGAKI
ncbi:MAG: isoaspartyl peptidase [Oscillospiraceae bacterium]|nr:isoaspartyl peptidase [Oscillospiraceae bacterium]